MKLTLIGDNCPNGRTCPRIYLTDRGTSIVQGYGVVDPEALDRLGLPEGESAVEIPVSLLKEAEPRC